MKRLSLLLTALGLLIALTGCDSAQRPAPHPAKAKAAGAFMETAKAGDMDITLAVDPLKIGENKFMVTLADTAVEAVEAQVIMASMGHGIIVDLQQVGPGRFEARSEAIDMDGRWMIRVKATSGSGVARDATFHLVVKR